jgi:hypothetical protein
MATHFTPSSNACSHQKINYCMHFTSSLIGSRSCWDRVHMSGLRRKWFFTTPPLYKLLVHVHMQLLQLIKNNLFSSMLLHPCNQANKDYPCHQALTRLLCKFLSHPFLLSPCMKPNPASKRKRTCHLCLTYLMSG